MPRSVRVSTALCALCAVLLGACTASATTRSSPTSTGRTRDTTGPPSASSSPPTSAPPSTPGSRNGPEDGLPVVDAALARLGPRQQVAQLFVVGVPLSNLASGDALVGQGVGGVFLAGRSAAAATDLAATTGRWASLTPGPRPWVATDQEGGLVQTLSGPGFDRLPSALDQGRLPPDQLAALADRMGASLHTAGVTLDLAPVADVVPAGTEAGNAPIGANDRQYGSTESQVGAAAASVVDRLAAHQVTATLKHFPGLGRVTADTDVSAGVTDTVTTAADAQVVLFGALAARPAAPMVMASLATYTNLDPTEPAAFSPAVLTSLLRGRLQYTGPVISDDLGKAAEVAGVAPGDRAVRFLAAGGTLVLTVVPAQLGPMIDAVTARAAADPAFAAQIDAAVRTALLAKARAGLLGG